MNQKIFLSVGDPSADLYAANLVNDIHKIAPETKFYGMGQKLMQDAGVELIVNSSDFALIGITEIFSKVKKFLHAFNIIENFFKTNKPDLLILIDFSGFNLRLAKIAKKYNIKVLYYICPQIWASRFQRIKKIKKYVDQVAVIFPFEVPIYEKARIPVAFVSHPLLNIVKPTMEKNIAKQYFQITKSCRGAACCARNITIGLFPGSRQGEIKKLMPIIIESAKRIQQKFPDVEFILPLATSITENDLLPYLQNSDLKIKLYSCTGILNTPNVYDIINICDAIIAKSGTTVLEIALLQIPMVIIYKTSWLNYFLAKQFIKIPFIGLCNIILGKEIVRELLQTNATAAKISNEIIKILSDDNYRNLMIEQLAKVREKLIGEKQQTTVEVVIKLLS